MGQSGKKSQTLESVSEETRSMLRPKDVFSGLMKVDPDKCTTCGLCVRNCPFKCWNQNKNEIPEMKAGSICFSCFNCMIACPVDAISIVRTFIIESGYFATKFPELKEPREPRDKDDNPVRWNEVERTIIARRSVRNFKKDSIPEQIINRLIEAGRFVPSAGNHQPWKFCVVTDPELINKLERTAYDIWLGLNSGFRDDDKVMDMINLVEPGAFDPRVQYGMGCIARKELRVFFGAPVVIFLGVNQRMANPDIGVGICGQNMNLAAVSLGLGICWSGFGTILDTVPDIKSMLGFDEQWKIRMTLCMGYPSFKQKGVV